MNNADDGRGDRESGPGPGEDRREASPPDDGNDAAGANVAGEVGESAEAQIAALEAALRAKHEDVLRERAEVENFKKRILREKSEALRFAQEPLLRDLLPVVDNLERAIAHAQSDSVAEGLQLVLRSLLETLARHGVERIDAQDAQFDPAIHEAIGQSSVADAAPGAVTEQHQVGYALHSRLLRPALVTVNVRKDETPVARTEDSD